MSRTENTIKNIKYSIFGQFLVITFNFLLRAIFVRTLSAEYLGINGLFSNILSLISLTELGLGTAIIFSLYKPLAEKDEETISALMRLYRKAYYYIGIFVFIVGILFTTLIPFLIKEVPNIRYFNLIYILYVVGSSSTYFFSYKRALLIADQKKHIDLRYHYLFYMGRVILQIIVLLTLKNFIAFLVIQIIFSFLENIYISKKVDKRYDYLKSNQGSILDKKYKISILKNVKALMMHKVGSVIVMGTDNIMISRFEGIVTVGLYSNYILIVTAINQILALIFNSLISSVGNLIATEKSERKTLIFNSVDMFAFWVVSFCSISLFILLNPFIKIWLGSDYLLDSGTVFLISFSFYITGMRRSIWTFYEAYGLYWYDRYKPIFESIINIVVSLILVRFLGINGIIIGTIISTISVAFWVEPYVLYKYGFGKPVNPYFIKYIQRLVILFIIGSISIYLSSLFDGFSIYNFAYRIIICLIIPNVILYLIHRKMDEYKYLENIIKNRFHNKTNIA
jgi:O-antigen/teichoic acid export membrane protein